jgi:hypothetical protein
MHEYCTVRQKENYLRVIVIIANKKPTAASPYIMPASLSIKNTSIKIEGLLFAFLINSMQKYLFM